MQRCPVCNAEASYVGLSVVECLNPECRNFVRLVLHDDDPACGCGRIQLREDVVLPPMSELMARFGLDYGEEEIKRFFAERTARLPRINAWISDEVLRNMMVSDSP
jgi:hypothetical protein